MSNSKYYSISFVCLLVWLYLSTPVLGFRYDVVTYDGLCSAWDASLSAQYLDYPGFATLDEIMWWCYDNLGLTSLSDYMTGPPVVYLVASLGSVWSGNDFIPKMIHWGDSLIVDTSSPPAPGAYTNFTFEPVHTIGPFDSLAEIKVAGFDESSLPRWLDLLHHSPIRTFRFPQSVRIPVFNVTKFLSWSADCWVVDSPLLDAWGGFSIHLSPAGYLYLPQGLFFLPWPGYQGGASLPLFVGNPLEAAYTASVMDDSPIPLYHYIGAAFVWGAGPDLVPDIFTHVNYNVLVRQKPE